MDLGGLLRLAVEAGASDLHLVPPNPPFVRVNGALRELGAAAIQPEDAQRIIFSALSAAQIERFRKEQELDTSFSVDDVGRFRINVFEQKHGTAAVLRVISPQIPEPEAIGLDETVLQLTRLPHGLIVVSGPTGSGKTTTLACLVNAINATRQAHILTIEDPIEHIYPKLSCVVTQREIGVHTHGFHAAITRAMRQDPDVILIGAMHDMETIAAAFALAETGHLVFAALPTADVAQTVDRMIDVFPPFQQQQARAQLASTLRAVICQQLVPRRDGAGRVAAREIMVAGAATAKLIREEKTHQIYSVIETGLHAGMKSMDRDLADLTRNGVISLESARAHANNPELLQRLTREEFDP